MPNYDYVCDDCEVVEEHFHAMSKSPDILCPNCGKSMRKCIGPGAGFIFRGAGFYHTDYKLAPENRKRTGQKKVSINKNVGKIPPSHEG